MVRALAPLALLALLAVAASSGAARPAVPLVESFLAGDRDDIARAGQALGARGLAPDLVSPDRTSAMAAVAAAPAADDGWELLPALADLAGSPDRSLASRAARAAAEIAARLDRDVVFEQEIPTEYLQWRIELYRALAGDRERWADVRVHALEVATSLARALPSADRPEVAFDLDLALADADPEVRRAALELLPHELSGRLVAQVAARLRDETDDTVAVVAAQVLCGGLAAGGDAAPILAAAGEVGLARIESLVARGTLPPLARIEAARCVVGRPGGAAALRALAAGVPAHLRPEAQALSEPGR